MLRSTDTGLCSFPLQVTISRKQATSHLGKTAFETFGPTTVTLRNGSTGRTSTLRAAGTYSVNETDASIAFEGEQVWFWANGKHVPYLSMDGKGTMRSPYFALAATNSTSRVVDPCALLAAAAPALAPAATPAPWGLPSFALSRMGYAGLIPLRGTLYRHDHVHLDVIVDGKKVTVPAGVGMAEPIDGGPCPPGSLPNGDCATGHFYTALVANAPLHTHSTSGLIHIEADRKGSFTLGQFFDEWGVRLSASCVGSYCSGGGKQLRVYVEGKRVAGDPRRIVLTNHQEIAVVFGGAADFRSVATSYGGGWPGEGCGGPDEQACYP